MATDRDRPRVLEIPQGHRYQQKPRLRVPRGQDGSTKLEANFDLLLEADCLPPAVHEYRFDPERDYRVDRAYVSIQVGFELEGGLFGTGPRSNCRACGRPLIGGHTSVSGILRDIEKHNRALELGWELYRISPDMIDDGRALLLVERVLARKGLIAPRPVNPIIAAETVARRTSRRWPGGNRENRRNGNCKQRP
ncbi:MAG: hypothetical protein ACM3US_09910 [Sphingomonadaceae bacterium]